MGNTGSRSKPLSGRLQNRLQLRRVAHEKAFQVFLAPVRSKTATGLHLTIMTIWRFGAISLSCPPVLATVGRDPVPAARG